MHPDSTTLPVTNKEDEIVNEAPNLSQSRRPQTQILSDRHGGVVRTGGGLLAWIFAIVTLGYLIPWAIAVTRGKTNSTGILLVNLLAGWTVIGWIIALVMACTSHQKFAVPT
jgi:hypothetical protein